MQIQATHFCRKYVHTEHFHAITTYLHVRVSQTSVIEKEGATYQSV